MFRVSPGVDIKEQDVSLVVPAVSTAIGAVAGDFAWGPVLDPTIVNSEEDLVQKFGKPTNDNFGYFFTAASFLSYSNNLRVVRTDQSGALNAVAGGTASPNTVNIKTEENYDSQTFNSSDGFFAAKYPGSLGNSLLITYCLADSGMFESWVGSDGTIYNDFFTSAPGTSDFCSQKGVENDEIHILVIDQDGLISGTPGTILERFEYLSLARDAMSTGGGTNYFAEILSQTSQYVYWISNDTYLSSSNAGETTDWIKQNTSKIDGVYKYFDPTLVSDSPIALQEYEFEDGATGSVGNLAAVQTAYEEYRDADIIDVNLIMGGPTPSDETDAIAHCNFIVALAETRHDSFALVSPPTFGDFGSAYYTDPSDAISITDRITSSSFGAIDSAAIKIYDKYNGLYRWVPANGSVAGLCARTDDTAFPWFSPAGLNRGQIQNVARISYNPKEAERDELYKARINPIVQFAGEGTLLYGDKTLLSRPSAFDRINVRRLFNTLEKAISTSAKFMLFEFNDEFTRARFVNLVEPYLRQVQANRGIIDFRVVCDETNNTPQIIDSNQFVGDIYIKPAKSINFITLNFVAVSTGVDFEEIVG